MGVSRKVTLRAALTGSKLGEKEVVPKDVMQRGYPQDFGNFWIYSSPMLVDGCGDLWDIPYYICIYLRYDVISI